MITLFNRVEILITMDMKKQAVVTQKLAQNNIEYKLKVTNLRSSSPAAPGSRARYGTYGENSNDHYEYKIYVKKTDESKANNLIHQG